MDFDNKCTASELAKLVGLKNLSEVADMTGQSTQTLNNWHNDRPALFKVVLAGCVMLKSTKKFNDL